MKGALVDSSIQLEEIDSLDPVLSHAEENNEQAIVVVSLDEISNIKKYNSAKKNSLIKIVALCKDGETEKLAEHQKKNRGADMYLPAPLNADYLSLVEEVFSMESTPVENMSSSFAEDPSIKFDLSSIEDELKDNKLVTSEDSTDKDLDLIESELSIGDDTDLSFSEDETQPKLGSDKDNEEEFFESNLDDVANEMDSKKEEGPVSFGASDESKEIVSEDKVSEDKKSSLEDLSFEEENNSLEESEDELEFEGAPESSSSSESLCFEVSDEEASLGASMDEEDDGESIDDLGDDLEFDATDGLETSDPDEDALNELVGKEVSESKNNVDELDLGGDSEGELDLSGDSEDELDLSGDSEGELDLSGDSEGELDLTGESDSEGELDLGGDSEDELDLGGDSEDELDLGGDSESSEPFVAEEGGQLPSEDDLGFPDMSTPATDQAMSSSQATGDATGDIDTTLVSSISNEDQLTDSNNEEFDYKTSMNNKVISTLTKTESNSAQTLTVGGDSLDELGQESNSSNKFSKGQFLNSDLDKIYHQFEVMQAQRDEFSRELEKERNLFRRSETEVIQLREELEELKVENKILKKRHERKGGDFQKKYDLSEEKRRVLEEKLRVFKNKYEESLSQARSISNSNKSAEKALESKVELMEIDHRAQITSREEKINDLRRSGESLQFNLETLTVKNQELLEKKKEIEERLRLVISSLRGSIDLIEEDQSVLIEEIRLNEEMDDQ
jgi:hypothetical protein